MYCIMTGKGTGAQGRAARPCDTAGEALRYGQGGPAILSRQATTRPAAHRGMRQRARGLDGGGVSRYNRLYRDKREA